MRRLLTAVAATAVLAVGAIAPAGGQEAEEPVDQILGVLSPIVSPACLSVGLSTVLVPLVGDQLGPALGGAVDVTSLLQQATGPVLVACGSFPLADDTTCALVDGPIELIWPAQLNDVGIQPLAPLGSVVETLTKLLGVLGLPDLGLQPVLGCSIPVAPDEGTGEPVPPPEFPTESVPAPLQPTTDDGFDSPVLPSPGAQAPLAPAPQAPLAPAPQSLGDVLVPVAAVPAAPGLRGPMLALAAMVAGGVLWFSARSGRTET